MKITKQRSIALLNNNGYEAKITPFGLRLTGGFGKFARLSVSGGELVITTTCIDIDVDGARKFQMELAECMGIMSQIKEIEEAE